MRICVCISLYVAKCSFHPISDEIFYFIVAVSDDSTGFFFLATIMQIITTLVKYWTKTEIVIISLPKWDVFCLDIPFVWVFLITCCWWWLVCVCLLWFIYASNSTIAFSLIFLAFLIFYHHYYLFFLDFVFSHNIICCFCFCFSFNLYKNETYNE